MKTLKLNIDYGAKETKESPSQITVSYIEYAVNSTHEKGLEGQMRRTFGRIQRKLDAAIDEGKNEVTLEESEKDFIKECFKSAKFPAQISKFVVKLEEEIERMDKEEDGE